ncbi:LptM family lipoprotein [Haloplasma contractile]|uniref:Membrane lipoprotein n=1 Tax=Haloplasma contractile SSD-17B TaxID=1033810 RepID=U2E911_9MOLU|nr:hypothetical protein [Haloplasma contractile]ERJ11366.1 membrane lipoprotein [Haloplasma contractile SSD-17B]
MKKVLDLTLIVSIVFLLTACNNQGELGTATGQSTNQNQSGNQSDAPAVETTDEEETSEVEVTEIAYQINDSSLDYEWMDHTDMFTKYQFKDGTTIFKNYPKNRSGSEFIAYDGDGNKQWQKEFDNIIVIDTFRDGILFEIGSDLFKIDLKGDIDWFFNCRESSKVIDIEDGGTIYQLIGLENRDHKTTFVKIDHDGNIEWQKGPIDLRNITHKDSTKIVYGEYRDGDYYYVLLDQKGNEIFNRIVEYPDRYFVTEQSFYLLDARKNELQRFDLNRKLIYTVTDINIEHFYFEFENQLVVSTGDKITKISSDGEIANEVTYTSIGLSDPKFVTSYEDGSYLVDSDSHFSSKFVKLDIDGNVLSEQDFDNKLVYIQKFSNGNILFEHTEIFDDTITLFVFDSSFNQIYQFEEFTMGYEYLLQNGDVKYTYGTLNGIGRGHIRFEQDGNIYLTKRDSDTEQLLHIDEEGNEEHLFDIYNYNDKNYGSGNVYNIFYMNNNKFLIHLYDDEPITIICDNEGNKELEGEYFGVFIKSHYERHFYLKTEDGIRELILSIPADVDH